MTVGKSSELFNKSVKMCLNPIEAEVAKLYNFVKSLRVGSVAYCYKQV